MNKIQRLALSIMKTFSCSMDEAMAFALDVEKAQSEPNGRIGKFQEFAESSNNLALQEDSYFKQKVRAEGGVSIPKPRERNLTELQKLIAYKGKYHHQ